MNHFVLPRGQYTPIIPFAKTNGTQLGMSAKELTLLLLIVFLCKYMKVLWLCKCKGFHNSFLRVYERHIDAMIFKLYLVQSFAK